jgi:secreted trypsin-like serine protease
MIALHIIESPLIEKGGSYMKSLLAIMVCAVALGCAQKQEPSSNSLRFANAGIIGGEEVKDSDVVARSTVALKYLYKNGSTIQFCSGTLISKDVVMTAGHCSEEGVEHTVVSFGIANEAYNIFDPKLMRKVTALKVNPLYNPKSNDQASRLNDISLLKLESPAPEGYAPVAVLNSTVTLKAGMSMLLAGFGIVDDANGTDTKVLKKVTVPLVKIVDNSILVTDQTTMNGACSGDSGGPAYYVENDRLIVYGVTRGPFDRAEDCHHYGEYTYASYFKDFIVTAAKELGGEAPTFAEVEIK